jgi:hypothetical protein
VLSDITVEHYIEHQHRLPSFSVPAAESDLFSAAWRILKLVYVHIEGHFVRVFFYSAKTLRVPPS